MTLWPKGVFRLYHFELGLCRNNMWRLCIGDIEIFATKFYVTKPTKKQIRQFKNNFYKWGRYV